MLQALSPDESAFYAEESNLVDLKGKSMTVFRELEARYGFVGGSKEEYVSYFHRTDMDTSLWDWSLPDGVCAVSVLFHAAPHPFALVPAESEDSADKPILCPLLLRALPFLCAASPIALSLLLASSFSCFL